VGKRSLHRGMQMKADGKGRTRQAGQPVFSPQVLAVGGEEQLAGIGQAKPLSVAIVRR
jgi:hypothetical protein